MNDQRNIDERKFKMKSRIGYIMLVVDDMNKSVDFYKKLLNIDPDVSSPRWSQFSSEQVMLGLHASDSWSDPQDPLASIGSGPKGVTFGLLVDDLQRVIEALAVNGIKPAYGPRMTGIGNLFYINDPDGHFVQICQNPNK